MGQPQIYLPKDLNGNNIPKFLDAFEYVWGNTLGDPQYFGYLNGDGVYIISKITGPGTAIEHVTYYMGRNGGAALATLWGDGTGLGALTYVEYDALY